MSISAVVEVILFFLFLLWVSIVDYRTFTIPNRILLYGLMAGGVLQVVQKDWQDSLIESLSGMLTGFFILFLLYLLSRGKMGFGDVKFVAVCGIYLGVQGTLVAILLGTAIGGGAGALLLLKRKGDRKQYMAYGPYLALGALLAWFLSG
ncbi:prepilin peptidase [Paenibacillus koleovorans]|uniref:prepilin peptidase n=1 Tax=Paenibacillus koleovorans TaxID=121608 RepID=UPI000FD6DE9B|nr:A24 family peptidase [Paenibacillus koleovorans]